MAFPTPIQFHHKRRGLFFGTEATAGTWLTDATVFLASAGVVPSESIVYAPEVAMQERNPDTLSLQPTLSVPGQAKAKITFSSRVITGTALGVAGPLSPLFKAAGLKEIIVASTSVTYVQDPSSLAPLSMGVGIASEDGSADLQYAISGAVCTKCVIKADGPGKPFMIDWEFEGKIASTAGAFRTTTDGTFPTITYIDDNAKGFKLMAVTLTSGVLARKISKLELDMGMGAELGVDVTDVSGYDYGHLSKQAPTLTVDPTKVPGAVSQDLNLMLAGGATSAAVTSTNVGGQKFTVSLPFLQVQSMTDASRGPISTWEMKIAAMRSQTSTAADAANSAVSLVFA